MWRGRGAWEGGGRLGKRASSATWSPCSSSILKMGQSRQHFSLLWAWNKILTHHQGVPPGTPTLLFMVSWNTPSFVCVLFLPCLLTWLIPTCLWFQGHSLKGNLAGFYLLSIPSS